MIGIETLSGDAQAFWFGLAFVALVVATVISVIAKAWTSALLTGGLAAYVLVFAWDAVAAT